MIADRKSYEPLEPLLDLLLSATFSSARKTFCHHPSLFTYVKFLIRDFFPETIHRELGGTTVLNLEFLVESFF